MKNPRILKAAFVSALLVGVGSTTNAQIIDSSFVNLDFDASTQNSGPAFRGFDGLNGSAYDVPGWQDYTAISDGGTEFEGQGWWNPYQEYAAFILTGEGIYNLSSYVIQADDEFAVSLFAKRWNVNDSPEAVITLFSGTDPSANVIGSFNTGPLTDTWTSYGAQIAATPGSIGQTLGIRVEGAGTWFSNVDEFSINVVPEPSTFALAGFGLLGMFMARRRS